jgi:MATE family multidrug resistance protein
MPFGIWLAFRQNMGLHGLWYGLTVSLIYSSTAGVTIALRADWNKESEKVQERLEAAKAHREEYVTHDGTGTWDRAWAVKW